MYMRSFYYNFSKIKKGGENEYLIIKQTSSFMLLS